MTTEALSAAAGLALALGLAYIPGLAPRFQALPGVQKRLAVALLLLAIAGGAQATACYAPLAALAGSLTCTPTSVSGLLSSFVAALAANQGTYLLAVKDAAPTPPNGIEP